MPKVTIEQLASMVQRGFEQMQDQFQEVHEHQATNTGALALVKDDVRRLSNGQDALREDLGERLTSIADALGSNIARTNRRLDDIQEQVTAIKEHPGVR